MDRVRPYLIAIVAPFMIVGVVTAFFSKEPVISWFNQGTLPALAVAVVTIVMMVRKLGDKATIAWGLLTALFIALAAYMQWQNLVVAGVGLFLALVIVIFVMIRVRAGQNRSQQKQAPSQPTNAKQKAPARESEPGDGEETWRDAISKVFVKTGAMSATEQLDRAMRAELARAEADKQARLNDANDLQLKKEQFEHQKAIERLEHAIRHNRPADVIARLEMEAYGTKDPKSAATTSDQPYVRPEPRVVGVPVIKVGKKHVHHK